MKKAIVLSVLGIAASGIAAFGQGQILFNNYSSATYTTDQVTWGANSGYTVGNNVDSASVEVQLFYELGTVSTSAASFAGSSTAGITGFISTSANAGATYGVGPGGFFSAGNQIITGWSSGNVTFMYEAWDTTTGATFALATVKGYSALWQETTAAGGFGLTPTALPPDYAANMPGVVLTGPVPEPTTMALGGLGLAALMLFRRKQA
ncbi:MAG: PEP-CTERM sorting domain-containing protein [Verrucomicrobiia bacterium]